MQKFTFPLLTISDIQNQLKNIYNLNFLTEEDLTKPKSDTITMIYTRILMIIYKDLTLETLRPSEEDRKKLKYQDHHEISVPIIHLFKHLSQIFSTIGCRDETFLLIDILKPDFRRTRYFLSALINFLVFYDEEFTLKVSKNEDYVKNKQQIEQLKSLKDQILKLQTENENIKKFCEDHKEEIKNRSEQIEELGREKDAVFEERKKIEEKLKLLNVENGAVQNNILLFVNSLNETCEVNKMLKGRIVENSAEVINILESKKVNMENCKNSLSREKQHSSEINQQKDKINFILNTVNEVYFEIEKVQILSQKTREICENIKKLKQDFHDLEKICIQKKLEISSDLSLIQNEQKSREIEHKNLESRSASLQSLIDRKKLEFQVAAEDLKQVKKEISAKIEKEKNKVEEAQQKMQQIRSKMNSLQNELERVKEVPQKFGKEFLEIVKSSVHMRPYIEKLSGISF